MKTRSIFLLSTLLMLSIQLLAGGGDEKENNAPTALFAASNQNISPEKTEKLVHVKNKESAITPLEKREIKEKIKEIKEEVKQLKQEAREKKGSADWDPKFKIGAILIAISILLAIVGIGWVAGLAALVGLFFVVVGLLHTYN